MREEEMRVYTLEQDITRIWELHGLKVIKESFIPPSDKHGMIWEIEAEWK